MGPRKGPLNSETLKTRVKLNTNFTRPMRLPIY